MMNWIKLSLVPPVGAFIIRLLGALMRVDRLGDEVMLECYGNGRGMIFAFWHSRQLMMPLAYRGRRIHVLISRHRDGEIIARLIGRFGFRSVRGSTTRGGMTALRSLIRAGEEGGDPPGRCEFITYTSTSTARLLRHPPRGGLSKTGDLLYRLTHERRNPFA